MSSYQVIQISAAEWAVEFTPAGHPASVVQAGLASAEAAKAAMAALMAQDEREAEQP